LRLWTSRWANRGLAHLDLVPVGISRGTPRFPVPYRYRLARLLAPSRTTFALRDDEVFERSYVAGLEEIGVDRIADLLRKISAEEGGKNLCLLCYENVHNGEVCHRRMFARWFEARTGIAVPELKNCGASRKRQDPQPSLFDQEGE
jgi:hypothetical protein